MARHIATKQIRYAGKTINVGDEFEPTERDGRLLVAIGKAKVATHDADPAPKYETRDVSDDDKPDQDRGERQKRHYNRRDLTAR